MGIRVVSDLLAGAWMHGNNNVPGIDLADLMVVRLIGWRFPSLELTDPAEPPGALRIKLKPMSRRDLVPVHN